MDQKTLTTLEFDKVRAILAGYTSFSAGETLAQSVEPTSDQQEAERWQAETGEAIILLDTHSNVTIGGARDVREVADNAMHGFTLLPESLLDIRSTIVAARNLQRQILKFDEQYPHLTAIAVLIEDCPGLVSAISQTLDERGDVLDSASPKLAKIRQEQRIAHGRIHDKLQKVLSSSQNQYLQEAIITMRNGRYVLPLKADQKGRIKGIVHDHSGSGATLWIEPMNTVELNNEYRGLQLQEQEEINRILAALSQQVADHGDALKRIVERMAEMDLIFARARYANVINGIAPRFLAWRQFEKPKPPKHANEFAKWTPPPPNLHPGSTIWIKGARHPLLPADEVVPTNLTLDEETFVVLITGPNTGGKTVSLKTTGLMVLMAQAGMHLPVTEARLTIFDNVFADIGDEQSIEQSLSTFSAHISNITRILDSVTDRSLVLFDELGSGTDPSEGAALAQAIVNFLRDKGATTFIATHYPELKVYASQTKGATNASMMFDVDTLSPTYEMTIGIPGRSNAFAIARRLGLNETILTDAMELIGTGNQRAEDILDEIYSLRDKMESEQAGTRIALRNAESSKSELEIRLARIEEERREVLEEAKAQAQAELDAVQSEVRRLRRQMRDAESLTRLKKISQQASQIELEQVEGIAPQPIAAPPPSRPQGGDIQVGDIVRVKTLNTNGEVISRSKKEVLVLVGRLQMRTQANELELIERPSGAAPDEEEYAGYIMSTTTNAPSFELDIRGLRVEDGLRQLNQYLDAAFLSHLPWVRIIHGKGTGRLRSAVRTLLKTNSHVTSWEEGKDGEGGPGVTVAKLVKND